MRTASKENTNDLVNQLINERPIHLFETTENGTLIGIKEPVERKISNVPVLYACLGHQQTKVSHSAELTGENLNALLYLFQESSNLNKLSFEHLKYCITMALSKLGRRINVDVANVFYIPSKQ
jgi:hypothetical protein